MSKRFRYWLRNTVDAAQPWLRNRNSYESRGWAWRAHSAGARLLMQLEYGRAFPPKGYRS